MELGRRVPSEVGATELREVPEIDPRRGRSMNESQVEEEIKRPFEVDWESRGRSRDVSIGVTARSWKEAGDQVFEGRRDSS